MPKIRVLFVCIHNSARSQMAESLMNALHGDRFHAESAGLEPGVLNPLAVAAMKETGVDISMKETRDVFDIWSQGTKFDYVITVCDEASGERCPVFPGISKKLHWSFGDPGSFSGTYEEKLSKTIAVREQIRERIEAWVRQTA